MTDKEKIKCYEDFLHNINECCITGDEDKLKMLISNAYGWSYSHRHGNGLLKEDEQDQYIEDLTTKLSNI